MVRNTARTVAVFILLVASAFSFTAAADTEKTSTLRIANSTNATLTIVVNRAASGGNALVIDVPPLSERTMSIPSGLITFTAVANRSSPVKTYSKEQTFSPDRTYAINLTPKLFGATFLSDRPSTETQTGITTNQSRLALSGRVCAEDEPANAVRYKWRTTGQGSFYWENGDVFCGTYYYDFAVIDGSELAYFKCRTESFVSCTRQPQLYVVDPKNSEGLKKMTGPV